MEIHLQDLARYLGLDPPPLMEHDCPCSIEFLNCGQINIANDKVEVSLEVGDTWLTCCKVMSRGDGRDIGTCGLRVLRRERA